MSEFDELPETFDPSTHAGTDDLRPISPGWYPAQMVENSVEHAKNGNGLYLLAVFEILSNEYKGRRVYQNVTLQNLNQQAVEIGQRLLKDIYDSVGITGPTRDIRVMLFKPVMARIGIKVDKDGIYPDRNCVTQVRPPDYQPKRGRTATTPLREEAVPKSPTPPSPSSAPKPAAARGDAPWRS
jgi:uncharacterized protein DUF669